MLERALRATPLAQPTDINTIMAGLRCGEVSPIAWHVISESADAFGSIDDEQCASPMRVLADPTQDDPVVTAGAAGACGPLGCYLVRHKVLPPAPKVECVSEQGLEMGRPQLHQD